MKLSIQKSALSAVYALGVACLGAWSGLSHACSADSEFIGSVCAMAIVSPNYASSGFANYLQAAGQTLDVRSYQALFALISTTYGGDGRTNFALPDLRGRMIIGAGTVPGGPTYAVGSKGGATSVTLTQANLPAHVHTLTTSASGVKVAATQGTLAATTSLSGLTTTTNLANIPFSSSSSSLSIKALSTNGNSAAPSSSAYLAKSSLGSASIYNNATPDTTMAVGSVVGTVSGTLTGSAPGTVSGGSATTTISGAPVVSISGNTDVTGVPSTTLATMSPYLAMYYFIAVTGIFPTSN